MNAKSLVINLGPKEKRKRLIFGIASFFLAAAFSIYFVFEEIPRVYRVLVWPLFFIAMLGFLQAKERTCVILAWKRIRNLDSVKEPIADCSINNLLIMKSQKMLTQAFLLAFALTLACYFS